jgi:serine/threonine-protein kinase
MIRYLSDQHVNRLRFQIDFSMRVLAADRQTPRRPFLPTSDFFTPDCDSTAPPVPTRGALEGESGYACRGDGDCHLLVIDLGGCRLYEMWRADIQGDVFRGGCLAVWDLSRVYPGEQRGEQCTSADASGLPITPLLFTADEVAKAEIRHALRFILPNQHIRRATYVHPATHSTPATSGPPAAPPYGARLRLKPSTDLSRITPAARVVARALQEYGMILADGGEVTFTAASDASSANSWTKVGLGPRDLQPLAWSDFEVVGGGTRYHFESGCRRTPLTR